MGSGGERAGPAALRRGPARAAIVLAIGFLVMAVAYGAVVPVFEAADEHTHYFYAQHLAATRQLPMQQADPDQRGPWEQEGSQPPLYYLAAAPLVALTGARLAADDLWYNDQNTMGSPAIVGNENRFIHPSAVEGWPWQGYVLAVHLTRLLSTTLAAVTLLLVFSIAARVFPARPWLATGAAALVGFNPQFLHVSATVSNDNAINLLAAATLLLLLRILDGCTDRATVIWLAVAAGFAPLAKLSGLVLVAFTLATLGQAAWQRRDARLLLRTAGPVVAATGLLSGWWYARNILLYGSVTGLGYMLPESMRRAFHLGRWLRGLPDELYGVWLSTWGLFGWFTVLMPAWVYRAITLGAVLALGGLLYALLRRPSWVRWDRLTWLALWWALVFASLLKWLTIAKGGHGRLLFPAIAALAVVMITGWRALLPRRVADRALALGVAGAMAALAAFALLGVLRPAYAWPGTIDQRTLPPSAVRVGAVFDQRLRLAALEHPPRAVAGELLPVTLYWEVLAPIERDGLVALRIDQSVATTPGAPLTTVAGNVHLSYPGRGNAPPQLLPPGRWLQVDRQVVRVPALAGRQADLSAWRGLEPGSVLWTPAVTADMSLHVYDMQARESWPRTDALSPGGGNDVRSVLTIDPPAQRAAAAERAISDLVRSRPALAVFEGGVSLYAVSTTRAVTGALAEGTVDTWPDPLGMPSGADTTTIRIGAEPRGSARPLRFVTRVIWHSEQASLADLMAFVHVVDAAGAIVAQFDSPPATYGHYPTSAWRAGDDVLAEVAWGLPEVPPPGASYSLLVGLYRPTEGAPRVPAFGSDGSRWRADAPVVVRLSVGPK